MFDFLQNSFHGFDCYYHFKNGNEKAFTLFYNKTWKHLRRHGLRIISDPFTVSCLLQEAFLKTWQFRHTMESLGHIYYFTRLNLTFNCYNWLRSPANRFHRLSCTSADDLLPADECEAVQVESRSQQAANAAAELLRLVDNAIPYLPPVRQNIMKLYFRYGYSCKQIARRYGSSPKAVSNEMKESIAFLKKILTKKQPQKTTPSPKPLLNNIAGENKITQVIFQLRRHEKLDFMQISQRLGLQQAEVQQIYIEALKNAG